MTFRFSTRFFSSGNSGEGKLSLSCSCFWIIEIKIIFENEKLYDIYKRISSWITCLLPILKWIKKYLKVFSSVLLFYMHNLFNFVAIRFSNFEDETHLRFDISMINQYLWKSSSFSSFRHDFLWMGIGQRRKICSRPGSKPDGKYC